MSISLSAMLQPYLQHDHEPGWCLAMVISKEGSSYRTPGAMMLIDPLGQSTGMVSGGCLEADVVRRSRAVLHADQPRYIEYDMVDDESFAAELGIGCRGKIGVFVQPVTPACHQLLKLMLQELKQGRSCYLAQVFDESIEAQAATIMLLDAELQSLAYLGEQVKPASFNRQQQHNFFRADDQCWSVTRFQPPLNLAVFGGGTDARPLVEMAAILGWQVSVIDHRPAYASRRYFPAASNLIKQAPEVLVSDQLKIDAALVLTHNLKLDAQWLQWIFSSDRIPFYVGLLGPEERKNRVLEMVAEVDKQVLHEQVRGPVGIDLGGELPESIALSMLADIHACWHGGKASPLYRQQQPGAANLRSV